MIERECIEEHIAKCRAFLLEWTNKANPPRPESILRQLIRIDVNIRQRWCDLYRTNGPPGITFTSCVSMVSPVADGLWTADLTQLIYSHAGKGEGKGSKIEKQLANVQKQLTAEKKKRASPKGGGKDRGNGKTSSEKPKGGSKGFTTGGKLKLKDGRLANLAKTRGGKGYCSYYGKGDTCKKKAGECQNKHVCAVMASAGRVCEQNHPSSDHTGPILQ